jgi:hypothetical protein
MSRECSQQLIKGEISPSKPVAFDHKLGSIARDMVSTSAVARYLLSARVVALLRKESFSGWRTYPVVVLGKDGKEEGGYEGLQITGRAEAFDPTRGIELPHVRGTLPQRIGMFFQNDEWDGTDFFLCGLRICVTERVKVAMQGINVDNIEFIRLDRVKMVTAPPST